MLNNNNNNPPISPIPSSSKAINSNVTTILTQNHHKDDQISKLSSFIKGICSIASTLIKTSDPEFKCFECHTIFNEHKYFAKHILEHLKSSSIQCQTCDLKFKNDDVNFKTTETLSSGNFKTDKISPSVNFKTTEISKSASPNIKQTETLSSSNCTNIATNFTNFEAPFLENIKSTEPLPKKFYETEMSFSKPKETPTLDLYDFDPKDTNQISFPTSCFKCGEKITTMNYYKQHLKLKHCGSREEFSCTHCSATYSAKKFLGIHLRRKHSIGALQCHICGTERQSQLAMDKHINQHYFGRFKISRKLREFTICPICQKSFHKARLKRHFASKHPQVKYEDYLKSIANESTKFINISQYDNTNNTSEQEYKKLEFGNTETSNVISSPKSTHTSDAIEDFLCFFPEFGSVLRKPPGDSSLGETFENMQKIQQIHPNNSSFNETIVEKPLPDSSLVFLKPRSDLGSLAETAELMPNTLEKTSNCDQAQTLINPSFNSTNLAFDSNLILSLTLSREKPLTTTIVEVPSSELLQYKDIEDKDKDIEDTVDIEKLCTKFSSDETSKIVQETFPETSNGNQANLDFTSLCPSSFDVESNLASLIEQTQSEDKLAFALNSIPSLESFSIEDTEDIEKLFPELSSDKTSKIVQETSHSNQTNLNLTSFNTSFSPSSSNEESNLALLIDQTQNEDELVLLLNHLSNPKPFLKSDANEDIEKILNCTTVLPVFDGDEITRLLESDFESNKENDGDPIELQKQSLKQLLQWLDENPDLLLIRDWLESVANQCDGFLPNPSASEYTKPCISFLSQFNITLPTEPSIHFGTNSTNILNKSSQNIDQEIVQLSHEAYSKLYTFDMRYEEIENYYQTII